MANKVGNFFKKLFNIKTKNKDELELQDLAKIQSSPYAPVPGNIGQSQENHGEKSPYGVASITMKKDNETNYAPIGIKPQVPAAPTKKEEKPYDKMPGLNQQPGNKNGYGVVFNVNQDKESEAKKRKQSDYVPMKSSKAKKQKPETIYGVMPSQNEDEAQHKEGNLTDMEIMGILQEQVSPLIDETNYSPVPAFAQNTAEVAEVKPSSVDTKKVATRFHLQAKDLKKEVRPINEIELQDPILSLETAFPILEKRYPDQFATQTQKDEFEIFVKQYIINTKNIMVDALTEELTKQFKNLKIKVDTQILQGEVLKWLVGNEDYYVTTDSAVEISNVKRIASNLKSNNTLAGHSMSGNVYPEEEADKHASSRDENKKYKIKGGVVKANYALPCLEIVDKTDIIFNIIAKKTGYEKSPHALIDKMTDTIFAYRFLPNNFSDKENTALILALKDKVKEYCHQNKKEFFKLYDDFAKDPKSSSLIKLEQKFLSAEHLQNSDKGLLDANFIHEVLKYSPTYVRRKDLLLTKLCNMDVIKENYFMGVNQFTGRKIFYEAAFDTTFSYIFQEVSDEITRLMINDPEFKRLILNNENVLAIPEVKEYFDKFFKQNIVPMAEQAKNEYQNGHQVVELAHINNVNNTNQNAVDKKNYAPFKPPVQEDNQNAVDKGNYAPFKPPVQEDKQNVVDKGNYAPFSPLTQEDKPNESLSNKTNEKQPAPTLQEAQEINKEALTQGKATQAVVKEKQKQTQMNEQKVATQDEKEAPIKFGSTEESLLKIHDILKTVKGTLELLKQEESALKTIKATSDPKLVTEVVKQNQEITNVLSTIKGFFNTLFEPAAPEWDRLDTQLQQLSTLNEEKAKSHEKLGIHTTKHVEKEGQVFSGQEGKQEKL